MVRGARSRDWNYCVAVVKSPITGIINCVVHGLEEREIAKFRSCLQESLECVHHPMFLPVLLTELKLHHFAILLEKRCKGLEEIEYETGMRHGFSNHPKRNPPRLERLRSRQSLDFDLITQKLTGLLGTFAFCNITFRAGLESLNLIEEVAHSVEKHRCGDTNQGLEIDLFPRAVSRRVTYLKGLISGAQNTRLLLEQRTQAQVQTVRSHPQLLRSMLTITPGL